MEQVSAFLNRQNDLQKKVIVTVLVLLGLMILFPPKFISSRNPILDVTTSESAGYHFILDDAAAEKKKAGRLLLGDEVDKYIGSGIEWGRLLMQLALVGGAAAGFLIFTKK
jgi:hypothetical protein